MNFTDNELALITCALRAAAAVFTDDAARMAENGQPALERQFKRQAVDAMILVDRIEEEG